jgi:serine/threonine protein kinase
VIGRKLLHYEIVARIGAGGMGEVWRAVDPRLEREVAIKILPSRSGLDTVRRGPLERRSLASVAARAGGAPRPLQPARRSSSDWAGRAVRS